MDYIRPNKKRIEAVFRNQMPDRVPNFEVLVGNPAFSYIMGRPMEKTTFHNIGPEDYIEFANKVGQDVIGMCFYFSPFFYEASDGSIKPLDFKITSRKDLKRLVEPDMAWLESHFSLLDRYEQAVKDTDIGLFVITGDFFTTAYNHVFGFENFMYQLYDDCSLVEEVLEIGSAFYAQVAKRVMKNNLTFFYVGDDIAYKSGTLINPDILKKIWLPRMKKVFEPALKQDIPVLYHSDGNIMSLMPDLIDAGISALNPIEPYGMDAMEIKKLYGKDIALVGNLDVGGSLSMGTTADVRKDAEHLIDTLGKDGGFVLASSHSITKNVKPENYLAMVETAQTYGVYGRGN